MRCLGGEKKGGRLCSGEGGRREGGGDKREKMGKKISFGIEVWIRYFA